LVATSVTPPANTPSLKALMLNGCSPTKPAGGVMATWMGV
jgi:hypothetical protein